MKRLFTILLLAFSLSSYAVDIELLKQSLVGMWHPCIGHYDDSDEDKYQVSFYLDGDKLMAKYVSDYSSVYDMYRNVFVNVFNEYATCLVDVQYDGTIEFTVKRKMMGYDKKGREERVAGGEYDYRLFFVDGSLVGTETWRNRYEIMQPKDDRGICKYKTLEQAERRGEAHAFPFGDEPFTTPRSFRNIYVENIEKFYKNGRIDELSNCNPKDYKYGFLFGTWGYNDDGLWNGYVNTMDWVIKMFGRDGNYYVIYRASNNSRAIVQIYPNESCGEVSFTFSTKQEFIGECEGYEWPWKYDFTFNVKKENDERLVGTREWTNVFGPIKACDIPEPENCNVLFFKWRERR